jgi:hypothetical protein
VKQIRSAGWVSTGGNAHPLALQFGQREESSMALFQEVQSLFLLKWIVYVGERSASQLSIQASDAF